MDVTKDVLYPRKVFPPSHPEGVDMAPLIEPLRRRMAEMRAAGLEIPWSWEHQSGAVPLTPQQRERERAQRARNVFGWSQEAQVDANRVLQVKCADVDEEDRKRLRKVRYVSPWIRWNWTDGTGRLWPGPSILHIAATPRPVQHGQQPFRLSMDDPGELFLSYEDYRLGGDDMADDNGKKKPPMAEEDTGMEDMDMEPEEPEPEPEGVTAPDTGMVGDILAVLAELGMVLPSDTNADNLLPRLHTAALTMKHHVKKGEEQNGNGDNPNNTPPEAPVPQEPQPVPPPAQGMALSHEQQQQIERGRRAERHALKLERDNLKGRIKALSASARINKPIYDSLFGSLNSIQLSLGTDGALTPNELQVRIESYEALPEGAAFPSVRLGPGERPRAVDDPEYADTIEAQAKQLVKSTKGALTLEQARAKVCELMGAS